MLQLGAHCKENGRLRVLKMKSPIAWVLCILLGIYIILAFLPGWHETVFNVTAELDPTLRVLVRFLLDPAEYVWKWIVGALILAIALFGKRNG